MGSVTFTTWDFSSKNCQTFSVLCAVDAYLQLSLLNFLHHNCKTLGEVCEILFGCFYQLAPLRTKEKWRHTHTGNKT